MLQLPGERGEEPINEAITDLLLSLFLDVFGVWFWSLWSLPVSLLQVLTGGGWGRLWEVRGQCKSV